MRNRIENLKAGIESSSTVTARIRNAGIEVSGQELALGEARSHLTLARTEMHAFKPELVDRVVDEGLTIVSGVEQADQRGLAELRFRRRGLAVSLGAILLLVVALALKVRQIDRRHAEDAAIGSGGRRSF
jgi:hypothetical protein